MKNAGKSRRTTTWAPTAGDPTGQQLVLAALELFALEGIASVSLRRITAAAGAANQSAVHYHFGNKTGLLRAALEEVNQRLMPLQAEALAELGALAHERPLSVREIVAIGFAPYVILFQQSREGRLAVCFLSRLTWESGAEGQELLVKTVRPYFLQLEALLRAALPGKRTDALGFHIYLAINNLIHGLTDITLLGREPMFGVDQLYRQRPQELLEYFYDYISAGLASAVADKT